MLVILTNWLELVVGLTLIALGVAVVRYGPARARPAGHCSILIGAGPYFGAAASVVNVYLLIPITLAIGGAYLYWLRLPALGTLIGTVIASHALGQFHQSSAVFEGASMPTSLTEMHEAPDSLPIALQDVQIRPELSGVHRIHRKGGGYTIVRVAPVVPVGWTTTNPVPAWIRIGTPQKVMESEHARKESGDPLVVYPILRLGQWAIGKGLDAHDLTELEDAPLFRQAPSKTAVLRWRLMGGVVLGITWLTMVCVILRRK